MADKSIGDFTKNFRSSRHGIIGKYIAQTIE
jgi:hypothetical protein